MEAASREVVPGSPRQAPHFDCDFEETPDGEFIWNASRVLLHHLEGVPASSRRSPAGKRVLELGSGLGHLGYGLARLGAQVTCTERGKCLRALEESLAAQELAFGSVSSSGGSICATELSWGEDEFAGSA